MRIRLLLLAALVLPGALAAQQQSKTDEEIRARVETWEKAIAAKDTAAIRSLHAKDAMVMPPNGKALRGQDALVGMWAEVVNMPNVELDLNPEDVMASKSGDLAIETGIWTLEFDDARAQGGKTQDNGKYVVVWRKEGGQWHVVRDIWNSDRAMPGM
jgi:uncharacterized protein (TIGR02246 family)